MNEWSGSCTFYCGAAQQRDSSGNCQRVGVYDMECWMLISPVLIMNGEEFTILTSIAFINQNL